MLNEIWKTAASTIMQAGQIPVPVTDTLIKMVQVLLTQEQARFIQVFKKPTMSFDELKKAVDLEAEALETMLNSLMKRGIVFGKQSMRSSMMIY